MWLRLIFKEMLKRRWSFLLSALAVAVAVAGVVVVLVLTEGLAEEARKLTVKMGQNVIIIPASAQPERYYLGDLGEDTMPEQAVSILTNHDRCVLVDSSLRPAGPKIRLVDAATADREKSRTLNKYALPDLADHFVAGLQIRTAATGPGGQTMDVIFAGQKKEEGRKTKPIVEPPPAGKAFVGKAVAEVLKLKVGSAVTIKGREIPVEKVLPPAGTIDDTRVWVPLRDAQQLLGKPGQINRIEALSCLCEHLDTGQIAEILQASLDQRREGGLPAIKSRALKMTSIALAREKIRGTAGAVGTGVAGLLAIVCACLVAGAFYFNVRERRQEIGVMLAVGYTPAPIMAMVLAKLLLVAIVGGVLGCVLGIQASNYVGDAVFARPVTVEPMVLVWSMLAAAGLTLIAGIFPLIYAARTQAADILRNS